MDRSCAMAVGGFRDDTAWVRLHCPVFADNKGDSVVEGEGYEETEWSE